MPRNFLISEGKRSVKGLRPQARFGAQPPKAALSEEINHQGFHPHLSVADNPAGGTNKNNQSYDWLFLLAGLAGFEPANAAVKVLCLTA